MQSPGADSPNLKVDFDNVYLWRFPTSRLEAEVVRDSLLAVAGELDTTAGGPELPQDQGLASRRRSLYFAHHGEARMAGAVSTPSGVGQAMTGWRAGLGPT